MHSSSIPLVLSAALALVSSHVRQAQAALPGLAYQVTYSHNMDGSLSPDGKRMVFIKVLDGREQLFIMDVSGKNQHQLTHDDAHHEDPAWSPDGKHIAFILIEGETKRVHTIEPDGSHLVAVTPATQSAIHPNWSPDSRRIAYCTDDDLHPPTKNSAEIYAIDLETKVVTTLIKGGVNTFPVWSPDGERMAFRRMIGDNSEVFVADGEGRDPVNLTRDPSFEGWPDWSPDGVQIAFAANRNGNHQIFAMRSDGSDVRLVANTDGRGTVPRWSRDGKTIYFTICSNHDFGNSCEIMAAPAPPLTETAAAEQAR